MTEEELIEAARDIARGQLMALEFLTVLELYPELEDYEAMRVQRMVQSSHPLIHY